MKITSIFESDNYEDGKLVNHTFSLRRVDHDRAISAGTILIVVSAVAFGFDFLIIGAIAGALGAVLTWLADYATREELRKLEEDK
jgi:hypothetical protein